MYMDNFCETTPAVRVRQVSRSSLTYGSACHHHGGDGDTCALHEATHEIHPSARSNPPARKGDGAPVAGAVCGVLRECNGVDRSKAPRSRTLYGTALRVTHSMSWKCPSVKFPRTRDVYRGPEVHETASHWIASPRPTAWGSWSRHPTSTGAVAVPWPLKASLNRGRREMQTRVTTSRLLPPSPAAPGSCVSRLRGRRGRWQRVGAHAAARLAAAPTGPESGIAEDVERDRTPCRRVWTDGVATRVLLRQQRRRMAVAMVALAVDVGLIVGCSGRPAGLRGGRDPRGYAR